MKTKSSQYRNKHYVYLHIDPRTSQVVYVGKGSNYRAWHRSNRSEVHKKWFKELESLVLDPIIKIIHVFEDPKMAFIREEMLISFLRRKHIKLFNRAPGGIWIPSGDNHPLFGKEKSPEVCRKISETRKRRKIKSWNKGKKTGPNPKVSGSQKIRMKGNNIRKGSVSKKETKDKISKSLIGNNRRGVKIFCENNNKIYSSVKEAWVELGLDERSVFRALKGEYRHVKGFKFRYI